ncbi:MAG: hypothetical protein ACE5KM_11360 [Planctomycetaceae bacterium]
MTSAPTAEPAHRGSTIRECPAPMGSLRARVRRVAAVALPAALIVGVIAGWESGWKYRFVPKKFGVVVPGKIYRSGQISKGLIEGVLVRNKIGLVVDLNGLDPDDENQRAEIETARRLNVPLKRFPLAGSGLGDIRRYAAALTSVHKANREGKAVLLHCHAGAKRSGVAVGFYRLLVQGRSQDEVVAEMQRYGAQPERGAKFIVYMNANMRVMAEMLVERGVIPEMPETIPQIVL